VNIEMNKFFLTNAEEIYHQENKELKLWGIKNIILYPVRITSIILTVAESFETSLIVSTRLPAHHIT